jgi:threonine dehydrogenase-like Zn-dependent dehydrogenase
MQARQVVWVQKGVAEVQWFKLPPLKEGEVLVRTHVSLISPGTERAFFLAMPNAVPEFPVRGPGYSNVGEIMAVGPKAQGLKIGQRVAAAAGHSSHYNIEASQCHLLPDGLSEEDAVFFNLIVIAMQGVRKARIELGEPVVIIGAGIIGLLVLQLAKLQGALPVVVVDKDVGRASFARKLGADATFGLGDRLPGEINRVCPPNGPAVVIEATGFPQPIVLAFQLARRFGRVILLGSTRGETEKVNFYRDVHQKGLTVIGAHNSTRPKQDSHPGWWSMADDFRTGFRLLELKRLNLAALSVPRFAAKDAARAYDHLAKGDLNAHAMMLDWR